MAFQLIINILLAVLWMFMNADMSVGSFITGYLIGLLAVYLLRNFLPGRFYVKRLYLIIKLVFIFIIELVKANIDVVKIVISPRLISILVSTLTRMILKRTGKLHSCHLSLL